MTTDRSDLSAAVLKMERPVYLQSLISWSNKAIKSEAVSAVGAFASRLSWTFSMFVSCYNDKSKRQTITGSFGPFHHIRERFTTGSHCLGRRFPKALNTISTITSDVTPFTQFVQLPWKFADTHIKFTREEKQVRRVLNKSTISNQCPISNEPTVVSFSVKAFFKARRGKKEKL